MSLPVNCSCDEFALHALEVEQETQRVLAEVHDCLSERGERVLASFLRELATPATDARPGGRDGLRANYHLVFAIPDSRRLLDIALVAKRRAWETFEGARREARDPDVRALAATLADVEAGDVRRLEAALEAAPRAATWEALIEQGTVPGLVLGAERRLRRVPRERGGDQNPPVR